MKSRHIQQRKQLQIAVVALKNGREYLFKTDLPVKIGDTVLLPTPDFMRLHHGVEATYEGTVKGFANRLIFKPKTSIISIKST